jgi:hypothetical protein
MENGRGKMEKERGDYPRKNAKGHEKKRRMNGVTS